MNTPNANNVPAESQSGFGGEISKEAREREDFMNETPLAQTNESRTRTGKVRVAFHLSMPNVGSWNGRWSGAGKCYIIVRSMPYAKAENILRQGSFYYRWNDGWGAGIRVEEVDGAQSRTLKRHSAGFCGYDWMVDSIIEYGAIYADHERPVPESNHVAGPISVFGEA